MFWASKQGLNHTLSWISAFMPTIHTDGQAANLVAEIHVKSNMPVANSILCHNITILTHQQWQQFNKGKWYCIVFHDRQLIITNY